MKLKTRILLLSALLTIATGAMAWWVARDQALGIVAQWAMRYAEKQVLYDKVRMMQPILREIALSRQLANSQLIKDWARQPDDAQLTHRALVEMETFRANFADHSYFLGLHPSGRYYHNNAKNEYANAPLRYTLKADKPADRWFYDIIAQNRDMHINVNPDVTLGVTKLWIDVLIRDGNDILGVAGTGLDLTSFIREVVENSQPGITSLFVDHVGAIQVYRDQKLIDFASITKSAGTHKTLDMLFQTDEDRKTVLAAMKEIEQSPSKTLSRLVHMQGQPFLVGLAYLPEIDWYEVTLLDINALLPLQNFVGMLLVFALSLLVALIAFNVLLGRVVLQPLNRLARAIEQVQSEHFAPQDLPTGGKDEIGHLMRLFRDMATRVWASRNELETRVAERTAELEQSKEQLRHLAQHDSLTGLPNRALLTDRLQQALAAAQRDQTHVALLFLDLDHFKPVNDEFGHAVGDQLLQAVAQRMLACVRQSDTVARIGGDEFLLLLRNAADQTDQSAVTVAEKIREALALVFEVAEQRLFISCSIGIALYPKHGQTDIALAHHADLAMYQAKQAGRNQVHLFTAADLPATPAAA
ncbi:MAG: diguanylate cyclase [Rhodoferax sp.]|uniref:diguanylate cyclase domain-containing protein n=1 Tax=Rhodoferax sp. TaxID=50421 RepID=UPI0026392084|nr:diguanylate cyclase [Rhodoferax sp.]MDD2882751.1 diguanylate cyclase [Rhodoferax sp.]